MSKFVGRAQAIKRRYQECKLGYDKAIKELMELGLKESEADNFLFKDD